MGEGFDFKDALSALFTIEFRFDILSELSNSFGTMSSNNTSIPTLANWQAIPEPMIPEPKTATFLMFLFMFYFVVKM